MQIQVQIKYKYKKSNVHPDGRTLPASYQQHYHQNTDITQHFIPMIDNTIEAPGMMSTLSHQIIMQGASIVLSIIGIKC